MSTLLLSEDWLQSTFLYIHQTRFASFEGYEHMIQTPSSESELHRSCYADADADADAVLRQMGIPVQEISCSNLRELSFNVPRETGAGGLHSKATRLLSLSSSSPAHVFQNCFRLVDGHATHS